MSYAHNVEADFAAVELARMFTEDPQLCYAKESAPPPVSATATYEPSSSRWPKADGLVLVQSGGRQCGIAVEYKRPQEGVHGLLTGLGQAEAYVHKGYNGAVLVIPNKYATHDRPGAYLSEVLNVVANDVAVGVFEYTDPDLSSSTPFRKRIECLRPLNINASSSPIATAAARTHTQWVHMREGSNTRDAFFRFLQTAKQMSAGDDPSPPPDIPPELREAVVRVAPEQAPERYLASISDDRLLSRVWQAFWFKWLATRGVLTPWDRIGTKYVVHRASTCIQRDDGKGASVLFSGQWGQEGGLKGTLVDQLNNGEITEADAWERFARGGLSRTGTSMKGKRKQTQGVRDRAHSYREDLDSALAHLNWIDPDGRPTEQGYRYVSLCERYGVNSRTVQDYVGATLLQVGHYGALVHYIHRWSEERFTADPLAFTRDNAAGRPVFNDESYRDYLAELEDVLREMKVLRQIGKRSMERTRTPLQAELTLLRRYGFVAHERHRLGIGIPIDWIKVQEAMHMNL